MSDDPDSTRFSRRPAAHHPHRGHGRGPSRYETAGYLDVVRDAGGKSFLDDRGLGDDRHIDKEKAAKKKEKVY